MNWLEHAACRGKDPDIFFPEGTLTDAQADAIRATCGVCPVRRTCLQAALAEGEENGVWGGVRFTRRGRTNILNAQRAPAKPRPPRPLQPCGTYGAYQRHLLKREAPCEACRLAHNRYRHERRNQGKEQSA